MQKSKPGIRTISSNEAKQRWGAMMATVEKEGDRVLIASHGTPKVAVISVHDLERLEALDEQERRDDAIRSLQALEKRIGNRNADLTDEDVEALADRAAREALDDIAAEGKLVFERHRK